jgi:predicted Zn finger-like uncharacterized protein
MGLFGRNSTGVSILTQCTTCHTVFRIEKSDLDRSGGHAKCGVCGMVFNALEAKMLLASPARGAENNHPQPLSTPDNDSFDQTADVEAEAASFAQAELATGVVAETIPRDTITEHAPHEEQSTPVNHTGENLAGDNTSEAISTATPQHDAKPEFATSISFKPKRNNAWYVATSATLMLILGGQIIWHFHGELAINYPALKPVYHQLCAAADCDNLLAHDIDALKISSSVFSGDKVHDHLFHVQLSVLNQSDLPMAFPAISLTLKNDAEEIISTKTIYPMDYLKIRNTLEHGIPAQQEWPINLNLTTNSQGASNYKMVLFYPPHSG